MKFLVSLALLATVLQPISTNAIPSVHKQQSSDSFKIEGAVEKPSEWTTKRIAETFANDVKEVSYTIKGKSGKAQCVPLIALVQAVKPKINAKIKNHQLSFVVLAKAADGYMAAFSMGELLPDFGKRQVWVALDRDGKALTGKDGPVELIVTDDEKGGRWVHGIRNIRVVDGTRTR